MISNKTIAKWVQEYNEGYAPEGYELEDWLDECTSDFCRNQEMESYFSEIDPMQSMNDGYMESHRREW